MGFISRLDDLKIRLIWRLKINVIWIYIDLLILNLFAFKYFYSKYLKFKKEIVWRLGIFSMIVWWLLIFIKTHILDEFIKVYFLSKHMGFWIIIQRIIIYYIYLLENAFRKKYLIFELQNSEELYIGLTHFAFLQPKICYYCENE